MRRIVSRFSELRMQTGLLLFVALLFAHPQLLPLRAGDLATVVRVDRKRVYACGMSNGGMMAYRLAAEMPERFAAIAVVSGVMCLEKPQLKHAMPILHFHGTKDSLIPFEGTKTGGGPFR